MDTVTLQIKPDPAHVRVVRLAAAAVARLAGMSEGDIEEMRLAVSEACGRAVATHIATSCERTVRIELRHRRDGERRFVVAVRDAVAMPTARGTRALDVMREETMKTQRKADTVDTADPAALLALPESVALITGLVDEVDVSTGPAGSVVQMSWPVVGAEG